MSLEGMIGRESGSEADDSTPPWLRIYRALRAEILSGRPARKERLPSEKQICARFGVTRMTVRRALGALQSEGLVTARKGVGVFVRGAPSTYQITDGRRFIESIEAHGGTVSTETLSVTREPAESGHARQFGLDSGAQIILVKRLRLIDGEPVFLNHKRMPHALFPDFDEIYAKQQSVHDVYLHHGVINYRRCETRISGGFATAEEAAALNITAGAPVLYSSNRNEDERGRPIEYSHGCWLLTAVEFLFPGGADREAQ